MAERRMFAKTIIDSDAFLDMPLSTQALYFHLSMRADDDGFINNPKKIQRMIGASDDDLKILSAKNFIIPFETGIVVIKHWKIHNYIRGDRKHETKYTEELARLTTKENGAYTLSQGTESLPDNHMSVTCQSSDSQMSDICQSDDSQPSGKWDTEVRLGKVRLGKVSKDISAVTSSSSTEEYAEVAILPCTGNKEWRCPKAFYDECVLNYPDVDIESEFRKMRMWLLSNNGKKKTVNGTPRFVNTWLSKAQDNPNPRSSSRSSNVPNTDAIDNWRRS